MAKFMFSAGSLAYHRGKRECKNCPHLHNSLLSAEGVEFNPLERFEVRFGFLVYSKRYPTIEIKQLTINVLSTGNYMRRLYKCVDFCTIKLFLCKNY